MAGQHNNAMLFLQRLPQYFRTVKGNQTADIILVQRRHIHNLHEGYAQLDEKRFNRRLCLLLAVVKTLADSLLSTDTLLLRDFIIQVAQTLANNHNGLIGQPRDYRTHCF